MLVFDAHLDLSLNALEYNRDLRMTVEEIRRDEAGLHDLWGRAEVPSRSPRCGMRASEFALPLNWPGA